MTDYHDQPLPVHESWREVLAPVKDRIHRMGDFLRAEDAYLPAGEDVLRAFQDPFDEVKVLIVGQDPYPTPGHAMGLSFSTAPGVKPPRSLVNIYQELNDDLGVHIGSDVIRMGHNTLSQRSAAKEHGQGQQSSNKLLHNLITPILCMHNACIHYTSK